MKTFTLIAIFILSVVLHKAFSEESADFCIEPDCCDCANTVDDEDICPLQNILDRICEATESCCECDISYCNCCCVEDLTDIPDCANAFVACFSQPCTILDVILSSAPEGFPTVP